jgi:hypothetical protein
LLAVSVAISCGAERGSKQDDPIETRASALTVTAPTTARQKTLALPNWENTSLAVPRNTASCGGGGAYIVSVGATPRVWRTDLTCINATTLSTCSSTSDVSYGSTQWPVVSQSGANDASPMGPTASNDQQIVRFSNGTLLMVHQGVRRDSGSTGSCTGKGTCRGVEYFFRSSDCGATWSFVSILDPKFDGPASNPSKYYLTSTQGGHDRPEMYVDPFNPSRVYLTVIGAGNSTSAMVLYRSNDRGSTWSHAGELPSIWTPAGMTTVSSNGKLYIAGWYGVNADGSSNMGVVVYDPASGAMTGPLKVSGNVFRLPGFSPWGSEGIARVESTSLGDTVHVHHTYKSGSDFAIAIHEARIKGSTINVVFSSFIEPAHGRSLAGVTLVEPDRIEYSGATNGQMLYWYDVDTTPVNGDFGPAQLRYTYVWGKGGSGPTGCMSLSTSANTCRSWSVATSVNGDYQKGAFWYDAFGGLNFVALWGEQSSSGAGSMSTNILRLVP